MFPEHTLNGVSYDNCIGLDDLVRSIWKTNTHLALIDLNMIHHGCWYKTTTIDEVCQAFPENLHYALRLYLGGVHRTLHYSYLKYMMAVEYSDEATRYELSCMKEIYAYLIYQMIVGSRANTDMVSQLLTTYPIKVGREIMTALGTSYMTRTDDEGPIYAGTRYSILRDGGFIATNTIIEGVIDVSI